MNPMRSPPPEIVNEGIDAMVRYMKARSQRVQILVDKLDIFTFDFIERYNWVGIRYIEDNLTPSVKDFLVIEKELCILTAEDIKFIELSIDNFVNSTFYRSKETIGSVCNKIRRKLRERISAHRSECLQALVKLLDYCAKNFVLEDHSFNSDLVLPWGEDGLLRKFYGFDINLLYRYISKSSINKKFSIF